MAEGKALMELRRQILLKKLEQMGCFETPDGNLLMFLTLEELELVYSRIKDREVKK